MQEAETNLKQAAVDFLEAAGALADRAADSAADPLDAVSTDLFELGDLEPAIDRQELADLKSRLRTERLLPATILELVALARQVAATLTGV
ncbi:MAG TPA: hypothetical protein VM431_00865 [Phycisphaerae bacterium]|nr:hypothetical protein [Phycisphaerae bacterium]